MLKIMKILIVGGTGFIGSRLASNLVQKKNNVVVLGHGRKNENNMALGTKTYLMDIGSPDLKYIFKEEKPQVVYYMALPKDLRKKISDLSSDKIDFFSDFKKTLDCSVKMNVQRFVFMSSGGSIYSESKLFPTPENHIQCPSSIYGLANLILEKMLQEYGEYFNMNYIILRASNVYGRGQNKSEIMAAMIKAISESKELVISGDGNQTRDFIYIDDLVNLLSVSGKSKKSGIFNVGSGYETSINELYDKISKILNKKAKVIYNPGVKNDIKRSFLSIEKAKKELDWRPMVDIDMGLKKITSIEIDQKDTLIK